jgi:hypothetical protein
MRVRANTRDLDKLTRQFKAAPKAVRREYRKGLKEIGKTIADDAKERIAPVSQEVAKTIKVRTRGVAQVSVQGGQRGKPIGRLLEGDGHEGFWTHPLFGDEDHRYTEARHPHLYPALQDHKEEAVEALQKHVKAGLRDLGLKAD